MKRKCFVLMVIPLFLSACATVSEKPVALEAPVPKAEQIKAQQAVQRPAAKRYKLKVSVGRFTNETNYGRSLLTDAELDRIGKQASDMLTSRLVQSGQFLVLERPDLNKVTWEQQISGDSKLVGSDTLIIGSVTEFGRSVGGKVGFLSSTKVQTAKAKVDVRLVDVKTSHAYFSAIGAGEANTESGEVAGFGSRASYDATLNDRAIAAAISDVIDKLVAKLADRTWKTDVLEVRDRQVFISGGKLQGLREGDLLAVMEAGDTIKSKQTGFDVTLPPKRVATIRVSGFFGESETGEGSICEIVEGSIAKPLSPRLFVAEPK
ncbi:MAG TPA: CsgG/HfaB family protein [Candidatus Deferrimicrobiaceae bacterium]|nr:CsgG/HfaB family protein [Candidatus Deferrimicrobiaceae bacterium]